MIISLKITEMFTKTKKMQQKEKMMTTGLVEWESVEWGNGAGTGHATQAATRAVGRVWWPPFSASLVIAKMRLFDSLTTLETRDSRKNQFVGKNGKQRIEMGNKELFQKMKFMKRDRHRKIIWGIHNEQPANKCSYRNAHLKKQMQLIHHKRLQKFCRLPFPGFF